MASMIIKLLDNKRITCETLDHGKKGKHTPYAGNVKSS